MHILALDEDAGLIDAALRQIPRKRRPQLKKVGRSQEDDIGAVRGSEASDVELEEENGDEGQREEEMYEGPMIERLGS